MDCSAKKRLPQKSRRIDMTGTINQTFGSLGFLFFPLGSFFPFFCVGTFLKKRKFLDRTVESRKETKEIKENRGKKTRTPGLVMNSTIWESHHVYVFHQVSGTAGFGEPENLGTWNFHFWQSFISIPDEGFSKMKVFQRN